jgi:integrase
MGFGVVSRDTLATVGESMRRARKLARDARDVLDAGGDPLEQKRAKRETEAEKIAAAKAELKAEAATLCRVARQYHTRVVEPRFTKKHAALWIASLENNVPHDLWHAPIDHIEHVALFKAMAALKRRIPETADKVRQRLDKVFDDAVFHGLCTVNPARVIRGKLGDEPRGREEGHYRALPYQDVPVFVAMLRKQRAIAARALEFALLTAARTGEVLGAVWPEIDEGGAVWRVPAARMKGGEDHVVHLSARALEIIREMRALGGIYVFPSPADPRRPLSGMAMLVLLERIEYDTQTTVHGVCRASFSTWANDLGIARVDVIEAALAHKEADRVRAAYNRASFAAERAALLHAWANYCDGKGQAVVVPPSAQVLPMTRAA